MLLFLAIAAALAAFVALIVGAAWATRPACSCATSATLQHDQLAAIINRLNIMQGELQQMRHSEQEVKDALVKIDETTTKIGTNVAAISASTGVIGTDVDTLKQMLADAQANGSGVSQELVDFASSIGDKVKATGDALDAQVPVLQAIAVRGVPDPTPLPVPDPMPAPDPTV